MSFGNVIPIDAEVARQMARRHQQFRWLVVALTAIWLAILVPVLLFTPLPPLAPFIVFAALMVLAEHRFVLFGDETSMSASIIVVSASIFVFADTSPIAAPMLIASLGGLYFPHLRSRSFDLVRANAAIFGVSAGIATGLASKDSWIGGLPQLSSAIIYAVVASAAYWYANSVLTGAASACRQGTSALNSVVTQATSEWPVLMLATASGLAAACLHDHTLPTALTTAFMLCMFEVETVRKRHVSESGAATDIVRYSLACTWAAVALTGSPFAAVVALTAIYFASSHRLVRSGTWRPAALGLAAAFAGVLVVRTLGSQTTIQAAASWIFCAVVLLIVCPRTRRLASSGLSVAVILGLALPRWRRFLACLGLCLVVALVREEHSNNLLAVSALALALTDSATRQWLVLRSVSAQRTSQRAICR